MSAIRQHLIDPEVCIRCNTCEENCPVEGAIEHNEDNYVVNADICNSCMNCIAPCPTGAIDTWFTVAKPYSLDDQYSWDELPDEQEIEDSDGDGTEGSGDDDASKLFEAAHQATGLVPAPKSAETPHVGLWTREKPAIAKVTGNYRITEQDVESDIHHIVLDFGQQAFPYLEGQSIGIIPPGLDDRGKAHTMRLYSIASARDGERPGYNNLSLTVKRVVYEVDGETRNGIGSNFMCDLEKGQDVQVIGPFGSTFLMPNDPDANIVMICTGTGAAPFRGMTERRLRSQSKGSGKMVLFFGARTPGELPYFGPLQKVPASVLDQELVFSRTGGSEAKEYVQDRIRTRAADVSVLLSDSKTHVYICGLKGMEDGVEEAFADSCADAGLDWNELRSVMREEGRYHVETY